MSKKQKKVLIRCKHAAEIAFFLHGCGRTVVGGTESCHRRDKGEFLQGNECYILSSLSQKSPDAAASAACSDYEVFHIKITSFLLYVFFFITTIAQKEHGGNYLLYAVKLQRKF